MGICIMHPEKDKFPPSKCMVEFYELRGPLTKLRLESERTWTHVLIEQELRVCGRT